MSHLVNAAFELFLQIETSTNHDGWTENRDYTFSQYYEMECSLHQLIRVFTDVDSEMYEAKIVQHLLTKPVLTENEYNYLVDRRPEEADKFFFQSYHKTFLNLELETMAQMKHDNAVLRMEQGF